MALTRRTLRGLIELVDLRNTDGKLSEDDVMGVSTDKQFFPTKANLKGVNLLSYKKVPPKHFAYVADTSRRGNRIALAYNASEETYLVSTWYVVFKIKNEALALLSPDWLFLYISRQEFDRY